jgi:3(or 17)beta-hydroxysteroid dehydrogenase
MGRVANKVVLVTGGGSGLGAAMCRLLAAEGAKVAVTDINLEGATAVADEINKEGGEALAIKQDVTIEKDWESVVAQTVKQYGGLHGLVNCAGIAILATVEETTMEQWRKVQSVNLDSVFLGTRIAIKQMKENGGGSIVNISSIEGLVGEPLGAAYNASKGGVRLFSKSAAIHCGQQGYGIRVNSVHPGFVMTPMVANAAASLGPAAGEFQERVLASIPLGCMGDPIDIAYGVLYLLSDESKYMTGAELVIDGGYTAK